MCFVLLCCGQVSPAVGEWSNSRAHCSSVLQGEVQLAAEIPSPAMSTGGTGTEAHLPASGGERNRMTSNCPVHVEQVSARINSLRIIDCLIVILTHAGC